VKERKETMIIKLVEIFELAQHHNEDVRSYSLREVYINPEHVICLREDLHIAKKFDKGQLPEGLNSQQRFTKVHLNRGLSGIDMVVIGAPNLIEEKLNKNSKMLLKG
jgi:hypothetical protein